METRSKRCIKQKDVGVLLDMEDSSGMVAEGSVTSHGAGFGTQDHLIQLLINLQLKQEAKEKTWRQDELCREEVRRQEEEAQRLDELRREAVWKQDELRREEV